jgi:hypothetical protein
MANSLTAFLTLGLKDNLTKPLRTVPQALKDVEARLKAVTKSMANTGSTDKFVASLAKIKLSAKDIDAVSKAWQAYAKSAGLAANSSNWTKEQLAGVRAWENQTLSALRRVSAEQQQFFARQARMARENRGMFSLGKPLAALGGPMVGMAVGGSLVAAVKEALGMGATIQERVAQLKAAGSTPAEIEQARADFRDFSKTHTGVLEADYLATYKDARVIAPAEAFEMAQLGARYRSALRNSGLSTTEEDIGNVMRIMDELGMKGMPERERFLDSFLKSQQAFGTQIQTETALAAYRNAKQSIYGWSPEFRERIFPTLLQSAGQQGGTEMMTALNNYVGHHMQKTEIESLVKAGFVRPQDVKTDHGRTTFRDNAKLFEADVFRENIAQWAWDFHDHYMKRKGSTETGFDDLIAKMPRNMAGLIAFLVHNKDRIRRDEQTLEKPSGLAAGDDAAMKDNPVSAFSALTDSLKQLAGAATSPLMTKAAASLTSLAETIQGFSAGYSEWAKANPETAKFAGAAGVGVGGAGGLALLYGAFNGLTSGFGLKTSAVALDESAAALTAAAEALGAEGVTGAAGGKPGKKSKGGSWFWPLLSLFVADKAADAADSAGIPAWIDKHVPGAAWLDNQASKIGMGLPYDKQGPGSDRAGLPYAPQLPSEDAHPVAGAVDAGAWVPIPSQKAMAGAYGFVIPDVKPKSDEAKAALDQLNATVKPDVDLSALDAAIAKITQLRNGLASLGRMGGSIPALGATQRGHFSYGGVSGE